MLFYFVYFLSSLVACNKCYASVFIFCQISALKSRRLFEIAHRKHLIKNVIVPTNNTVSSNSQTAIDNGEYLMPNWNDSNVELIIKTFEVI